MCSMACSSTLILFAILFLPEDITGSEMLGTTTFCVYKKKMKLRVLTFPYNGLPLDFHS